MNELNGHWINECAQLRYRDLLQEAERERLLRRAHSTFRRRGAWRERLKRTLSLLVA